MSQPGRWVSMESEVPVIIVNECTYHGFEVPVSPIECLPIHQSCTCQRKSLKLIHQFSHSVHIFTHHPTDAWIKFLTKLMCDS